MGSGDGKVVGPKKIVDKGPEHEQFTIVLLADGYTKEQQSTFNAHCDEFVKALTAFAPFDDCAGHLNFYRVNVESSESGADDPKTTDCTDGTGATAKTYFDSTYCTDKIRRLMSFNHALATKVLDDEVKSWDRAMVLVNSSIHGGAGGGKIGITATGPGWTSTALHEFGHVMGLADEYPTWFGCPGVKEKAYYHHSGVEPSSPNATTKTKRSEIKWRKLILPTTKVPTTENADCTRCDTQADPMPAGTVGLYEGAEYCHCGAYRPSYDCLMRSLGADLCAVCQAWIRDKISQEVTAADLAITPWGYSQVPRSAPYWQTPDIWGDVKTGRAKNDLHIRVRNVGGKTSQPFKVRITFVPATGVIDSANEILIDEVSRPALKDGGTDEFVVNWDLTQPALPAKYAGFDHFCVIADIQLDECNISNNRAQNNFVLVGKPTGGPPPPLTFEIANPWDIEAELTIELTSHDRLVRLHPVDFDPEGMILQPGERRPVNVAFDVHESFDRARGSEVAFDISQSLNGELLGGVSGKVRAAHPDPDPH